MPMIKVKSLLQSPPLHLLILLLCLRFVLSYISMTTVFCVNFSWPTCAFTVYSAAGKAAEFKGSYQASFSEFKCFFC